MLNDNILIDNLIDDLIKESETLQKIALIISDYKKLEKTVGLLENKLKQIKELVLQSWQDLDVYQLIARINKIGMVADYENNETR